jgi:GntR family transcriptional regulator, rspAB operon transcriptional repressor
MLQSEGLVDSEPNRRVRVAHLSIKDVEELYTIRVPLEVTALRLSMPRMTPEDIAELEGYMAAMAHFAAAEDYDRWRVPHAAFHRGLTIHSGTRFDALLIQLLEHSERYRRMHFGQTFSDQGTIDHREILDACEAKDPDLAAALLARHLARTVFEIVDLVEPTYELAALREVLDDVARVTGHPVEVKARARSARKGARSSR